MLKQCPFCGDIPKIKTIRESFVLKDYIIIECNCGIKTKSIAVSENKEESERKIIDFWNTRYHTK